MVAGTTTCVFELARQEVITTEAAERLAEGRIEVARLPHGDR